jgi:hypothetical protein
MVVTVTITKHSGFAAPPTVVVAQPAAEQQGEPMRPTLRLVT